jgi:hypothetical protein
MAQGKGACGPRRAQGAGRRAKGVSGKGYEVWGIGLRHSIWTKPRAKGEGRSGYCQITLLVGSYKR